MKNLFLTKTRWLVTIILLTTLGSGNAWGQASTHTSNVTLTAGTNGSACKVSISGNQYDGIKMGTSSKTGSMSFSVPAGVTTVYIHAAKWKGETGNLTIARSNGTVSPTSVKLTADAGVTNNSPFTLSDPSKATTDYFFTLTLSSVNSATTVTLTTSSKRAVVWGVNSATKTFTLAVPKGDGTYDKTQTGKKKTDLTETNAISAVSCGNGLNGTYADMWTSTDINTPTSTYPSPVYTSSTADGSLPNSGTTLYPVFINDAGKYLTNPSCAAAKTLSSIAITTQPTTTKYIVGETFSKTGAVVTASYSDATTADVSSSATWTPTTGLTSGSNTITASYTEGGVTKAATTTVTAYTVTVQKQDEDGTTIADAGVTASATGRTLTASTGSTKYAFKQWKFGTASGTSIASATSASTSLTGTPSAAVTVIAEFYKPVTVTWVVNGSEYTTTQVANGSKPEFPSNPSSCDGTSTTFVGWTPTPWSGKLDDVSAKTIYTSGSAMPNVSGPITYHAVFAKETSTLTPMPNTWTRITSTSQLTDGATVMLVQYYSDFAINNTPGATSCIANDEITNSNAALRWIAVKSGSKWKFKTSAGKYLSTSATADNTTLSLNQTYDEWTISADAGGYSNCFNLNNGNDLEYYRGNFKLYKWSSNYKSAFPFYIYIQKTTGSTTYSQYLTTCCTSWSDPTFSYNTYSLTAGGAHATKTITGTTHGTLSFESSNTGVITVDAGTGEVTPVGAGTAYVIAHWTEADGYCAKDLNSSTFTVSGNVTVTFKKNGGTGTDNQTQSIPYKTATALKTLAEVGYTAPSCKEFYGWADSQAKADAGTRDYTDGQSVTLTAGVTLYAVWKTIQYTVALGTGTATGCSGGTFTFSPSTVDCDGTVTITSSPDDNHKGSPTVTILPAGSGTVSGNTITGVRGNITSISVSYAEKVDVTATWNVNNGSVTGGGTTTKKEGSTFTFPNVTSTDCGTFLGWTNAANSSYSSTSGKPTPFYSVGSTIVLNENTQFYAVYSKVSDDAVSGVLYHHADDGTDLSDDDHTGVTVTGTGLGAYNSAPYIKFDGVGDKIIFELDGTPTSFAAAFTTASNGTAGFSGFTLYESDETSGPWTQIGDEVGASYTSTSFSLNITTAASFSKRVLKLEMTHKSLNVGCGEITINGLRAPINYTTNPGCVDWVLDAINVTTAPTKTTYGECEEFEPAGMVVTATMKENGNPSNTTTKDVAGYTWTPIQFLTPGNSIPVTISYTEKGVTKTTTTNVKVTDLPNYTITFHDGDNTFTWTQSNHCDACDLDSRTGSLACGEYTFAGWSTSSTSYDDVSATISTWVSGSYTPTANTHLYAVYRKGAAPAEFTANCIGGTFTIGTKNGGSTIISHAANVGSFNSYEYGVANSDYTEDQLGKFLFEKVGENTYKISLERNDDYGGGIKRFYIAPDDYSAGAIEFLETYDANQCKWKVIAGTSGSWRIYTEFRNSYITKDYGIAGRGNDGSTPRFRLVPTGNINGSDNYDVELTPVATPIYQSNPRCGGTYAITFDTHGGTFVQGNYAYSTETTDGLSDPTNSYFPSATIPGCTFVGWKEGSAQEDVTSGLPGGLFVKDAVLQVSSNKTYHAVYYYFDDDWEFDPEEGGTYHMYATDSETKYFCSGTPSKNPGTLTSTTNCASAVDVIITPGTEGNAGKYTINIDGYDITPELDDTGIKQGTFWWNINKVSENLYHITADGAELGRSFNFYKTGKTFTHYKDNGAGLASDISFGRCRQHHWTSDPVLMPRITLGSTGALNVTSTNGKTVKSTNKLTVSATRYGEQTKLYFFSNVAGVGFLQADGSALSKDATGSYIQTNASGELSTTNIIITYSPTVETDGIENVTITVRDNNSPSVLATATRNIKVRHLPAKFVIATKIGDDWYALPNAATSGTTYAARAKVPIVVDNATTPTTATVYSSIENHLAWGLNVAGTSTDRYTTDGEKISFVRSIDTKGLEANASGLRLTRAVVATNNAEYLLFDWTPSTTDLSNYTLQNGSVTSHYLATDGSENWTTATTGTNVRFLIYDKQPAPDITWYNDMLGSTHATNKAENGVVTLPTGADPEACAAAGALLTFDGWVTETWNGYKTSDFKRVNAGDAATTITYYAVFKTSDNKYFTKCPSIQTVTYKANGGTGSDVVESYAMVSSSGTAVTLKDIGTGDGQIHFTKEGYVFVGWTTSSNYGSEFKYAGNSVTVKPEDSGNYGDLTLSAVWVGELTITGDVHLTSTYTSAARSEANTVYTTANPNNLITFSIADVPASVDFKLRTSYLTSGDASQDKNTCPFRLCNDGSSNYNIVDGSNLNVATGDYSQTYAIGYKPSVTGGTNGTTETYKLKMELINSGGDKIFDTKTLTLYGRVLPNHFVIAAKINGQWCALPADIATSSGNAIANAYPITVDNQTTPTVATAAPKTALYSGTVRAHNDHRGGIRLTTATGDGNDGQLQATRSDNAYLWRTTSDCTTGMQEWYLVSSNFSQYEVRLDGTLKRSNAGGEDAGDDSGNAVDRQLCVSGSQILFGKTLAKTMYILPVTEEFDPVEIQVVTWKSNAVQFMYLGNPTYTAEVEIEGVNKASAQALGSALKIDHGVYEIAVSDLMSNPNKQMHIIIKNGGSEIGRKAVTIPLMTNSATTVNAARTAASINKDDCSGLDLVVLGNVLTADDATAHAFNSVTVYGGAKLSVTGNLTTKKMYLRAGNVTAGTKGTTPVTSYSYVYPQVYVGSSSTLTINENIINFDYLTNYDQYFGVAFPHTLTIDKNNIFYPEDIYGSAAKPGSYLLRVFDSQIRAERGAVDDVWVDVETGSTAMSKQTMTTRGLGYYVLLPPRKVSVNGGTNTRQKYGIQRMKLSVANAAALTTAENSNATIAVTAYSASSIVNTGWWMLGNPYMASLGTGTGDADRVGGASITVGSIGTNAQGQYEWKSSSVRYVTVPDDGAGDTYDQRRVIDYDFPAFKPFYVQVGASGDVTFSYASRNTAAPARISNNNMPQEINVAVALSTATYGDTTYLLVGDGFSDEYEIGDDLMKMPHANVSLFTISSTYDLFANALNKQSAENGVPVGYTAPSAGYYLFSHVENAESAWLEHLWLEDKETGAKVDLLDAPYEFETIAGMNKTRFVLFAVLKKNSETPTDIGGTEEEIDKPIKFIYNDKMYILRNGILYDATGKKVREINK